MQSQSITKACLIPVCNNQKFSLVHKFPADKERFAEWIEAIQRHKPIEKLDGMTDEAIRKRFFICSRHFGLKEYKNIESRSLNLTAVPHLNLVELDALQRSKAWQIKSSAEDEEEIKQEVNKESPQKNPTLAFRILNPGASSQPPGKQVQLVNKRPAGVSQPKIKFEPTSNIVINAINLEPSEINSNDGIAVEPLPKRVKRSSNDLAGNLTAEKPENIPQPSPEVSQKKNETKKVQKPVKVQKQAEVDKKQQISGIEEVKKAEPRPEASEEPKPSNKLLALIEVTTEQFEKLSKSLSASDRNESVTALMNFIGNDAPDPNADDYEIDLPLSDDRSLKLDLFWLRDHCRCEKCYDQSTHQRKISVLDIPDDIKTKSFVVDGETLRVIWSDGHQSFYALQFLIDNQPGETVKLKEISLWTKETLEVPMKTNCRVSMRDYMSDPAVSKLVLESLHFYGVAFIDGVQPTQQNTEFVIRQLFPVHKTLFGEMWTFSDAKQDHSDTAYTNIYLGPHNDNTYFNDAAGLQILHCIQRSGSGGENFLIDGFQVADKVRREHPEVFARLTKTILTAEYIEDGQHHKHSAPIISLDPISGDIVQIRFNLYDRAPLKSVPSNKLRQFYSDLKVLAGEFENPANRITFKLEPGSVLIFDNWRVLHGRLAYTGKRTMTGCYVARTEFQSALRVNNFIE